MPKYAIHEQWLDGQAQAHAIGCWLNCYLREFALPQGQADLDYRGRDRPSGFAAGPGRWLRIGFDDSGYAVLARAARVSRLGRAEYAGAPYLKRPGEPWRCADAQALAAFLLDRLAPAEGFNHELLAQSGNSIAVTRCLLECAARTAASGDPVVDAEQSLLWGHALHPTPKSREGVDLACIPGCSPEARARFPLYWFRVDPRLWRGRGRDVSGVLAQLSGGTDLYPCHPWEAARVLAHPLMQRARARGWVEPVGPLGEPMWPTSSVRTLYHPRSPYFLKLSIHVRLTNCVRKNAWYELESAVALTALLAPVWREVERAVPGFSVLAEPAATTLEFGDAGDDPAAARELSESFGIVYRDNFAPDERERLRPTVAAALFAFDLRGASICRARLQEQARACGRGYAEAAEAWFAAYARCLLHGVWYAFFRHGVVLEPHLQNTSIGFERGWPTHVWVRDLEGTKLVGGHWSPTHLQPLSPRAQASVRYPRELGWKRVSYCALVNNLGEAVFHLAGGEPLLEDRLWRTVAAIAREWQQRFGRQPLLEALLDGAPLAAKNNLRTRLLRRPDRESDYTLLPNPMAAGPGARAAA